jgi:hypothetical protein
MVFSEQMFYRINPPITAAMTAPDFVQRHSPDSLLTLPREAGNNTDIK